MTEPYKIFFVVPGSIRAATDEGWQTVEPAHINIWRSATNLLRERTVVYENKVFTVSINWTSTLRQHEQHYAAMKYLNNKKGKEFEARLYKARFPRRPAKNAVSINSAVGQPQRYGFIAESVIHDIFLIMNIAAPASCDFHGASLVANLSEDYPIEISLSNSLFECALYRFLTIGWPPAKVMELATVISWFDSVRRGTSQIPHNPMERALFALLHMSKSDVSPMHVVLIFYAFESLLQTKVGENFSAIVARLSLLLELDSHHSSQLKKKMRALYNLRSAIVHGGFELTHPMHNDVLDKRVEKNFSELIDAFDFGHAILIAAIQKTIENGWQYPCFDERIGGHVVQ